MNYSLNLSLRCFLKMEMEALQEKYRRAVEEDSDALQHALRTLDEGEPEGQKAIDETLADQ